MDDDNQLLTKFVPLEVDDKELNGSEHIECESAIKSIEIDNDNQIILTSATINSNSTEYASICDKRETITVEIVNSTGNNGPCRIIMKFTRKLDNNHNLELYVQLLQGKAIKKWRELEIISNVEDKVFILGHAFHFGNAPRQIQGFYDKQRGEVSFMKQCISPTFEYEEFTAYKMKLDLQNNTVEFIMYGHPLTMVNFSWWKIRNAFKENYVLESTIMEQTDQTTNTISCNSYVTNLYINFLCLLFFCF